jgi:hypothetical protein
MRAILVFLPAVLLTAYAAAQIPGGNFEEWNTLIFEYPQHANWTIYHETLSPESFGLLEKSTDASEGNYAIKLSTTSSSKFGYVLYGQAGEGGPSAGIPFADNPTQLTIAYKCDMMTDDSAQIWVHLYKDGNLLTEDHFKVGGTHPEYSDMTFNLSAYTDMPDSLMFAVVPGDPMTEESMTPGSEVYFDNVRFNGTNNLQLPDNSFEEWALLSLDYTAEIKIIEALCEKTTDAYNGDFAMKITTQNVEWDAQDNEIEKDSRVTLWGSLNYVQVGEDQWEPRITGGLPVHARKDTLVFYYKYIPPDGVTDTAQVSLRFAKNSMERTGFYYNILEAASYNRFEIPYDLDDTWDQIPVEADSMIFEIESSKWREYWTPADVNIEGSSLYIDYMFFKSQEAGLGIRASYPAGRILLYPNPNSGDLYITGLKGACTFELITITGAVIYHDRIPGDTRIDLKELPAGMYFVKLDGLFAGRIILEK